MSSPFADWTEADWEDYMATSPEANKPAPRKVDPMLSTALKRGLMMMYLNEMKPTKAPKKIAEMEKISRLVRQFVA
jgi:hypothetical protein